MLRCDTKAIESVVHDRRTQWARKLDKHPDWIDLGVFGPFSWRLDSLSPMAVA